MPDPDHHSAHTDPATQLEHFRRAVELLGGSRSAARALNVSERTISRLLSGSMTLHDGFLADMAAALIALADEARALERRLSPAFAANLIEGQPKADGRRAGGRKRAAWED